MGRTKFCCSLGIAGVIAFSASFSLAQDAKKPDAKPAAKPEEKKEPVKAAQDAGKDKAKAAAQGEPDMAEMMKLAAPGEQHKMLIDHMAGEWTYVNKHFMAPGDPPSESNGTATVKSILGGRYIVGEHKGKFSMPGADGKMTEMMFEGFGMTGYDNAKQKYVQTWADNMGTGILTAEGTYDPSSKTLTLTGEVEMMPGQKVKFREVIKVIDKNKHTFEWYDNMMGAEMKRMEITYTRKGAA